MQSRMALVYVLALALGTTAYAGATHVQTHSHRNAGPSVANGVPLSWAPDWLVRPLSRAIADATDPRERSKETGAPLD